MFKFLLVTLIMELNIFMVAVSVESGKFYKINAKPINKNQYNIKLHLSYFF